MNDLSVVMPLFDAEAYVAEAIRSVLDGADGLLELIVADDASTDGGPQVAAAFGPPVRVLRLGSNLGPAAARNRGLAAARGRLVGFLDSDDLWAAPHPDPRRALLEDPAVDVAMGMVRFSASRAGGDLEDWAPPARIVQLGAVIARREVLDRYGGLDETLRRSEDTDWLLRLRQAGARFAYADEAVVRYRSRPGSLMRDSGAVRESMLEVMHRAVQRTREPR